MGKLDGRIALITGASRGLGRAVALAYAKEGAHVIAVATKRSKAALEELDDEIQELGGHCTLVPFNLTDYDAIDRLGALIYERWGRLDVLVANAGILGPITPLGHIDPKDWQKLMDINLTANWRMVRSFDPLLKLSQSGRAIFVSTGAVTGNYSYWGGYTVSKAALEALAYTYANECETTNIKVNVIDPGATATRMRASAYPGEDPESLPQPEDVAPLYVELGMADYTENGGRVRYAEWARR